MKNSERKGSLIPNGIPKYLRIYDNGGESLDRYTIVFTGRFKKSPQTKHTHFYKSASTTGAGVYMWGERQFLPIDKPRYSHLGKKIKFEDLDTELQKKIIEDYKYIWEIK